MSSKIQGWIGHSLDQDRYKVIKLIGEGGMGFVYQALDTRLDTDVVIKVPHRELVEDQDVLHRFIRETRSLVKLTHPHVVKISDVGEYDNLPYIVMQHLAGGDLSDRLSQLQQEGNTPSVATLVDWLHPIARALDFIHQQGYVHRDIKPANIIFDDYGNPYLSDFGIAKGLATKSLAETRQLTSTGMALGTPDYMAPEMIMGQEVDGRADQYALSVVAFEALCGKPPFDGPTAGAIIVQHASAEPPNPSQVSKAISTEVSEAILKALSKTPSSRFRSVSDFVLAMASTAPVSAHAVTSKVLKKESDSKEWKKTPRLLLIQAKKRLQPINRWCAGVLHRPEKTTETPSQIEPSGTTETKGQEQVKEETQATRKVACPECGRSLTVTSKVAGKRALCPGCKQKLAISQELDVSVFQAPQPNGVGESHKDKQTDQQAEPPSSTAISDNEKGSALPKKRHLARKLIAVLLVSLLAIGASKAYTLAVNTAEKNRNKVMLKQVQLAILNYDSANRFLPANTSGLSWRVQILPFLEQKILYDRFHHQEKWNSPHNLSLLKEIPEVFAQSGDKEGYTRVCAFSGRNTAMRSDNSRVNWEDIADGTSNTAMLTLAYTEVPWTAPQDYDYGSQGLEGLPRKAGETLVSFLDGHVAVFDLSHEEEEATLRSAIEIRPSGNSGFNDDPFGP